MGDGGGFEHSCRPVTSSPDPGTSIMEGKIGAYEPMDPEDILEIELGR